MHTSIALQKSGLDRILLSNRGVNGWNVRFVMFTKCTNIVKLAKAISDIVVLAVIKRLRIASIYCNRR